MMLVQSLLAYMCMCIVINVCAYHPLGDPVRGQCLFGKQRLTFELDGSPRSCTVSLSKPFPVPREMETSRQSGREGGRGSQLFLHQHHLQLSLLFTILLDSTTFVHFLPFLSLFSALCQLLLVLPQPHTPRLQPPTWKTGLLHNWFNKYCMEWDTENIFRG